MQQTKSYWRLVAVASVVSAFVASACVVTTSTDDDDDDTAGTGGTATAGAGSGGKAGAATAGSGGSQAGSGGSVGGTGPVPFQCDPDDGLPVGTPNSCTPDDPTNDCQKCIQSKCCTEYEECYATDPGNQCGWGGPPKLPSGEAYPGGEALCVQLCIQDGVKESGTEPDAELKGTCASNCATTGSNGATKECGSSIGFQTNDLIACLSDNCSKVCFGPLDPG
ncbi:MAG: hypothetical protein WDO74_21280 [Pseudomonadota bacterium]